MGWWATNTNGESFAEGPEEMLWGDGPADILAHAVDAIVREFEAAWGRPPTEAELVAGMRFSLGAYDDFVSKDKWGNPVNEDGEPIGVTNEEGWQD